MKERLEGWKVFFLILAAISFLVTVAFIIKGDTSNAIFFSVTGLIMLAVETVIRIIQKRM